MAFVGMYCICGEPYELNKFMIQCDVCKDWLHGSCVGLKEYMSSDLDRYHCPRCEPAYGASVYKPQTNWHRHNYSEPDAENKPVQTGTAVFIKELKTRHFPSADSILVRLRGHQLTLPHLYQNGFDSPIVVEEKEGLEMLLPPENFSVKDVEAYIGSDREVDVIDVTRQSDIRMRLGEFVEYYLTSPEQRTRVLNIISLEFSHTQLSQLVEAPYIARKLDWVNFVWPKDQPDDTEFQKPEVQKYCLMGVQDSYTDFHVDFGGSSVWYHLLKGEKIFYLIKPTQANLSLYQRWMTSSTQSETFFGDQVDMCYKCVMKQGETMLIPTGWIHAVLTPTDSLVFGGNFLHSLNIPMQLQIYEIEKKIRTPEKFRFPAFEATNWYAARTLTEDIRHMNEMGTKCPNHLLLGAKALIFTLKQWNQDKDFNKSRREQIPLSINGQKLLKDLSKEVRHAERYLNSLNPPKPERESKRKKKKPVNKDFVDFSQAQVFEETNEAKEPLKLTLKTVNRNHHHISTTSSPSSPVPRPPLKLTLPKPAMYPYSTSALSNGRNNSSADKLETTNPVLTENIDKTRRSWAESQPHVKFKSEELKIKSSKTDCSVFIDETKAMLKSGTVLRFKLGAKDSGININDSVYDFHDESDEDRLMIDEMPKKRKHNLAIEPFAALKMKFASNSLTHKLDSNFDLEVAGEVDVVSDVPKNGIEELLKASGYTADSAEPNPRLEEIEPGRASPSTREAIAGMLSISRAFMPDHGNSKGEISSSRLRRKKMFSDDYGENIDKVHQDDDYIYPALDASDDEDLVFKPRGKRKLDEAWNPKARVGPLTPKTDRPTREGTKKQSVEKGLEAAAAKRAGMPLPKRPYNRKKPKLSVEPQAASSSTGVSNTKKVDVKFRKPKKGMATAKQRLGKILKIHKMKF